MIVTARHLQDLQAGRQAGDQIVLPYGARLTPLALESGQGQTPEDRLRPGGNRPGAASGGEA